VKPQSDAEKFAVVLRQTQLKNLRVCFGELTLHGRKGVSQRIQYNQEDFNMLGDSHEYTFTLANGDLQLSLQLYQNFRIHDRLFCYNRINGMGGMLFSINLTTEKEASGIISLDQQIKFSEGRGANSKETRRQKQQLLCDVLLSEGFLIFGSAVLVLGTFDTHRSVFLDTTPDKFLLDFIRVSILKGHFMGNKGYQLETIGVNPWNWTLGVRKVWQGQGIL